MQLNFITKVNEIKTTIKFAFEEARDHIIILKYFINSK